MDSENSFDDIIEYDTGSSSEKENVNLNPIRQPKTTNEQFNKIATFVNEHDEKQIDKVTYNLLWDDLAAKLNDIGPPDHTTSEWRRIWSVHKYNNKRKLVESDFEEHIVDLGILYCCSIFYIVANQSTLSVKIDVIIGKQSEMIMNQQLMIQELQSSNKFLQEIARK